MLSEVKMPLKGEVGIVMEITLLTMENHKKNMEWCFLWESCVQGGPTQL